jgi:hypothetical protein
MTAMGDEVACAFAAEADAKPGWLSAKKRV